MSTYQQQNNNICNEALAALKRASMSVTELNALIDRLLPKVLADRQLGDGRSFTPLHLNHLWALSCLHVGECFEQDVLETLVSQRLPPTISMVRQIAA